MSVFSRIVGVFSTFFQIGGPAGPGLNDNAGTAIEARNAANTGFVNLRAADPVNANDAVTLEYFQAAPTVGTIAYPNFQGHHLAYYNAQGAPSVVGSNIGFSAISSSGVSATPAPSIGSKLNATRRTTWSVTAGTQQLGVWEATANPYLWRGNAANLGGFKYVARFSLTSLGNSSQILFHVGVGVTGASPGFVDYTTDTTVARVMLVQSIVATAGGAVPAGTNWKISECTGAANTLHDTGIPVAINDVLELFITCTPNATLFSWTLNNITQGTTASGTVNTTIPSATTFMQHDIHAAVNVAGSGGTNALTILNYYVEWFD